MEKIEIQERVNLFVARQNPYKPKLSGTYFKSIQRLCPAGYFINLERLSTTFSLGLVQGTLPQNIFIFKSGEIDHVNWF